MDAMMARLQVRPERVDAMLSTLREITPLATAFGVRGEINLMVAGDHVVLDACEEIQTGQDRIQERHAKVALTWRDAEDLRRGLDCLLRGRRAGRWSETALAGMAEECVR